MSDEPPLVLAEVRERVRILPRGSRQHQMARLWLTWLAHIRFCQLHGNERFSDQCRQFETFESFLAAFPWKCCDNHRTLSNARSEITRRAEALMFGPAAHQITGILTPEWWRWHHQGYHFNPRRRIIQKPYGGMGDD